MRQQWVSRPPKNVFRPQEDSIIFDLGLQRHRVFGFQGWTEALTSMHIIHHATVRRFYPIGSRKPMSVQKDVAPKG